MIGSASQFGNTASGGGVAYLPGTAADQQDRSNYCRRARRIRRKYANNPALMHRRLRQLSDIQAADYRPKEQPFARTPSLAANSPAAWQFADRVTSHLQGGLLRYSQRVALIKEAERLGIKRFEANLIIAVAQHRHRPTPATVVRTTSPAHRRGRFLPTMVAVELQVILLGLLYAAFA
jgi:hypothetical protein